MNANAWLQPAIDARANDTQRVIDDDPTTVTRRRANVADSTPFTVRIVTSNRAIRESSMGNSAGVVADVTIIAPVGTDLRRHDLLRTADGALYRVLFVAPEQEWRVEADAVVEG